MEQVRDEAERQADDRHDELRDPDPDDGDRQRGEAGDEDREPNRESEDLRGGQTHMAARDDRKGAISHRESPDDGQPGEQRILRETAARIPWRASTTTAGPTNGNALSCAGGDSIGIASGKPWNPWAVKNPRPRSGLRAIVGAPQCFWVFIIDCGVECHF